MVKYCEEFFKITFKGKTKKDAYLKANKWYAVNVLCKDELQGIIVEYEKDKQSPTVTLHLFASIIDDEVREKHCQICRQMHTSFFINEEFDCTRCYAKGFQNRVDKTIAIKKEYYRGKI